MSTLNFADLIKVIYRSLYIQAALNYERLQGLGYCFCLIPFAKKLLERSSERALFLERNLEFFNTHPYMASWIIGATIKLEEESLVTDIADSKRKERFKKGMSESLAAIGDQLFWNQIKPITAMLGFLCTLYFNILGVVIFFILYNLPHFYMRIKGVFVGYKKGFDITEDVSMRKYKGIIENLLKVAAFLTGMLVIFTAYSEHVSGVSEAAVFLSGVIVSCLLLKMKVAVPIILMVLILASVAIGGFLY